MATSPQALRHPGQPTIEIRQIRTPGATDLQIEWNRRSGEAQAREEEIVRRMISLRLLETDRGADELEIVLDNEDLSMLENPFIVPNATFQLRLGSTSSLGAGVVRSFTVIEWRGLRPLTIRCMSAYEWSLNRDKAPRTYNSSRISDIVKAIGYRNGLSVANSVQETNAAHTKKTQTNQTDAQFLKQLAEEIGFVWYIEEGYFGFPQLFFHERRFKPSNTSDQVATITIGDDPRVLDDPIFDMNLGKIANRVTTGVYSLLEKKYFNLVADVDNTARAVIGRSTPIDENSTISMSTTSSTLLQGTDEVIGAFKEIEREMISAKLIMRGDPLFRPKRLVFLQGLGKLLTGAYYVDSIEYQLGVNLPFTMELRLMRNAFGFTASEFGNAVFALRAIQKQFQQSVKAAKDDAEQRAEMAENAEAAALEAKARAETRIIGSGDGTWDVFTAEVR
ncbi:MAG TPA: hypothetical protein VFH61_14720 [Thermoleophilia bacterium]|nr:hypothetical protein [Thermoleophilia bacterium]